MSKSSKPITPDVIGPAERELIEAILELRSLGEGERFFTDLCTPTELRSLADRWRVARLLDQQIPYREIYQRTGVSTATITRVARALLYGKRGYQLMLGRLGSNQSEPTES